MKDAWHYQSALAARIRACSQNLRVPFEFQPIRGLDLPKFGRFCSQKVGQCLQGVPGLLQARNGDDSQTNERGRGSFHQVLTDGEQVSESQEVDASKDVPGNTASTTEENEEMQAKVGHDSALIRMDDVLSMSRSSAKHRDLNPA